MSVDRIIALRDAGREVYRFWMIVSEGHGLLGDGQRRMATRIFRRINEMIFEAGGVPLSEADLEKEHQ